MTAARQERKSARLGALLGASLVAAGASYCAVVLPVGAATTERVVTNQHTGLAIGGYDPLAYFVQGKAQGGRPEIELRFAGATWRFRNEGNRAAFAAAPAVYAPRFGGYDPIAIARGASAPGHPEIWIVVDGRLYLFHSEAARDAFAGDSKHAIAAAERRWPEVQRTLTP